MITFGIGLFIGSFIGFFLAAILAMGRDEPENSFKKPYRRHFASSVDLFGRLGLRSR
jgi:hypothetical protein